MKWNTDDISQAVDILTKDGNFSENETREAHNCILDAWVYYHDKTSLTLRLIAESNCMVSPAGHTFKMCFDDTEVVVTHTQRDVDEWDWYINGAITPKAIQPTTIGDLRQLISKLEGGAG